MIEGEAPLTCRISIDALTSRCLCLLIIMCYGAVKCAGIQLHSLSYYETLSTTAVGTSIIEFTVIPLNNQRNVVDTTVGVN